MDFYHSDLEAGRTEEAHPLVVKDVAQSQPNYTAQFYESGACRVRLRGECTP